MTRKFKLGKGFKLNAKDGKTTVEKRPVYRSVSDKIAAEKKPKKRFVRA